MFASTFSCRALQLQVHTWGWELTYSSACIGQLLTHSFSACSATWFKEIANCNEPQWDCWSKCCLCHLSVTFFGGGRGREMEGRRGRGQEGQIIVLEWNGRLLDIDACWAHSLFFRTYNFCVSTNVYKKAMKYHRYLFQGNNIDCI